MRGLFAHADLARYAGQFVWLELNYDKPENAAFLAKYGASATPTFFIIDAQDEKVVATQTGAMSLQEVTQFLDRGTKTVLAKNQTPADAALSRGDSLLAEKPAAAADAYRDALRLGAPDWNQRELAQASLAGALQASHQFHQCAETAASEAAAMKRDAMFGRTVVAGMWCVDYGDPEPWAKAEGAKLEPLAREALSLQTTVRDHRDELYRTLMYLALAHDDKAQAAKWGGEWLRELDQRKPRDEEERSAVDIARVENVQAFGDPERILPALIASEQAMPNNYNASLRVAQMESAAKHYDEAIAACNRGLARAPGALGRSWLLQTKAEALKGKGKAEEARSSLEEAMQSAESIPNESSRANNVKRIKQALEELQARGQN
jgi:tetratricopeptide (TPR) repeat protein